MILLLVALLFLLCGEGRGCRLIPHVTAPESWRLGVLEKVLVRTSRQSESFPVTVSLVSYPDKKTTFSSALLALTPDNRFRGAVELSVTAEDSPGEFVYLVVESEAFREDTRIRVTGANRTTSNGRTAREEPGNGRTALDEPGNGHTAIGEPRNGRTVMDKPGNGRTTREEPSNGRTAMNEPGNGRTATDEPGNGRTKVEEPGNGRTALDEPGNGRTTRDEPGNGRNIRDEPGNGCTTRDEPGKGHTARDEPGNGRTAGDRPGNDRTARDEPGNGRNAVDEPDSFVLLRSRRQSLLTTPQLQGMTERYKNPIIQQCCHNGSAQYSLHENCKSQHSEELKRRKPHCYRAYERCCHDTEGHMVKYQLLSDYEVLPPTIEETSVLRSLGEPITITVTQSRAGRAVTTTFTVRVDPTQDISIQLSSAMFHTKVDVSFRSLPPADGNQ